MPRARSAEDFWDSLGKRDGFLQCCFWGCWVGMLWLRKSGKNVWMWSRKSGKKWISQKYPIWNLCWGTGWSSSLNLESREIPGVRWRSQSLAPNVGIISSLERFPPPGFSWGKFQRNFLGKILLPSTGDPKVLLPVVGENSHFQVFPWENSIPISSPTPGVPKVPLGAGRNNSGLE